MLGEKMRERKKKEEEERMTERKFFKLGDYPLPAFNAPDRGVWGRGW